MNVLPFPPTTARHLRFWTACELERLVHVYEAHAAKGEASGWDVGATELDDPQFYVLGPGPDCDCLIAISRVGRIYVLETGTGRVLAESPSLEAVAATAERPFHEKGTRLVARLVLGLAAVRAAVEERIEPILVETEELLVRMAPQLAALV
jgi:hypothetical protein